MNYYTALHIPNALFVLFFLLFIDDIFRQFLLESWLKIMTFKKLRNKFLEE